MTDPNENRKGYKQTKVGWIPDAWGTAQGAELTVIISKGASPKWQGFNYTDSGMLFVTSENVREGTLDLSKPKYLPLTFHAKLKRTQLRQNDILVNLVGASIGRSCRVQADIGPANINQAVAVLRMRDVSRVPFIAFYLQAPSTIRRILEMQVDAARPNISLTDLRAFIFPLPPLPEQQKIAEILSIWDDAIEQTAALIESKRQQKKALMQQLLSGHRRLQGFKGAWRIKKLHDICDISKGSQRNRAELSKSGTYPVINGGQTPSGYAEEWNNEANTITISEGGNSCGFVQIIRTRFWCGGHCYALTSLKCEKSYLYHLLKKTETRIMLMRVGSGLPNIQKGDLSSLLVAFPEVPEQRAIAAVLDTADKEITSLVAKLEALRQQKKGLMQRLLTGQVRVGA